MAINLKKYESQLRAAIDDVLSDSDTDWYETYTVGVSFVFTTVCLYMKRRLYTIQAFGVPCLTCRSFIIPAEIFSVSHNVARSNNLVDTVPQSMTVCM